MRNLFVFTGAMTVFCFSILQPAAALTYEIYDLFPPGLSANPWALNNRGEVAASGRDGRDVYFYNPVTRVLTYAGYLETGFAPWSMNNSGQMVGYTGMSSAAVWDSVYGLTNIGASWHGWSSALSISESGAAAGRY